MIPMLNMFDFETTNDTLDHKSGKVLVVDDDRVTRTIHHAMLVKQFDVVLACSGDEALSICADQSLDLIILDVEMPGLNGYETCRKIRESSTLPIIFVTAHSSLESQLEAFDAGGNDIICKPVSQDLLLRKAALAIKTHVGHQRLLEEKNSLHSMAMGFLSSIGENGVLLSFLRSSIQCRSYDSLAEKLVDASRDLGIQCYGIIRHADGQVKFRTEGESSPLEESVLGQLSTMGRLFQFKRQLVVNYDKVSIVVSNIPLESPEKAGTIRDNVAILAETAEALCDNVSMRQESMMRAEQLQIALISAVSAVQTLRNKHSMVMGDTRMLLQELIDNIEKAHSWLGTTTDQEIAISNTMDESVLKILNLLSTSGQFNDEFDHLLSALNGPQSESEADLWC